MSRPAFSEEYQAAVNHANPRWKSLRQITLAVTLGHDCLLFWLRARDIDHLTYRRLGHEYPFFDVVPLSRTTHRTVTNLRKIPFLAPIINTILRLAYGTWILAWLTTVATIGLLAENTIHPGSASHDLTALHSAITDTGNAVMTIGHMLSRGNT